MEYVTKEDYDKLNKRLINIEEDVSDIYSELLKRIDDLEFGPDPNEIKIKFNK